METINLANVAVTGNVVLSVFTVDADWEVFIEQLKQYFEANAIGEDRQVAVLLTFISESVHTILKNLCHPVRPITKTLAELITLLDEEFKAKVPTYRKRIEFDQLRQNEEGINEWCLKVKKVASKCEFDQYLDFRVKDKFVSGMKPGPVLDRLCQEQTSVSLSELLEIALVMEAEFGHAGAIMDIDENIESDSSDDSYEQGPGPTSNIRERHTIWSGVLEWIEKAKYASDSQKITRHVPCQVSANIKDGEAELKADGWPQKLIIQLMPKHLIGNIGGAYLKNSKSVLFHPQNCEALESLTKVMSSGFAGCVHFTSVPNPNSCDIRVLILLYTVEKRAYLGLIPNDQNTFVNRLRNVIQHQKSSQMQRQEQGGAIQSVVSSSITGNVGAESYFSSNH